jgi:hypothetical protein
MSIFGKIFEVAIDIIEVPIGIVKDVGNAATGDDINDTEKKLQKLKKDLEDL